MTLKRMLCAVLAAVCLMAAPLRGNAIRLFPSSSSEEIVLDGTAVETLRHLQILLKDKSVDPQKITVNLEAMYEQAGEQFDLGDADLPALEEELSAFLDICLMATEHPFFCNRFNLDAYIAYARYMLCSCQFDQERYPEALKQIEAIWQDEYAVMYLIEWDQYFRMDIYRMQGWCYIKAEDYENGIASLRRNMEETLWEPPEELIPIQHHSYQGLRDALPLALEGQRRIAGDFMASENDLKAVDFYVKTKFLSPPVQLDALYDWYLYGSYYLTMGFYEEALEQFEKGLTKTFDKRPSTKKEQGRCLGGKGKAIYMLSKGAEEESLPLFEQAERLFREAGGCEQDIADMLTWRIAVNLQLGNGPETERLRKELRAVQPENAQEQVEKWIDWLERTDMAV